LDHTGIADAFIKTEHYSDCTLLLQCGMPLFPFLSKQFFLATCIFVKQATSCGMNVAKQFFRCVYIVDLKMTSLSLTQSVQVKVKVLAPCANIALNPGSRGLPMAIVILMNVILAVEGITMVRINMTAIPMMTMKKKIKMTTMMIGNA
jgi:hypothetical protein